MTVRDEYEKVRKKYNLPSFDALSAEFDLCGIEDEVHVLREIRHRVQDRLEFASGILDTICQPDTNSVRDMMECGFFSDLEKKRAYALTQRLMALWRGTTEAELLNDEKGDAEMIKLVHKDWPALKQELLPFVRKMRASWHEAQTERQELGYLG